MTHVYTVVTDSSSGGVESVLREDGQTIARGARFHLERIALALCASDIAAEFLACDELMRLGGCPDARWQPALEALQRLAGAGGA